MNITPFERERIIRLYRQGASAPELSARFGVSSSAIRNWANSRRCPTCKAPLSNNQVKICAACYADLPRQSKQKKGRASGRSVDGRASAGAGERGFQRTIPSGQPIASADSAEVPLRYMSPGSVQVNIKVERATKDMLIALREWRSVAMSRIVEDLIRREWAAETSRREQTP